jgi:hypothetical protein
MDASMHASKISLWGMNLLCVLLLLINQIANDIVFTLQINQYNFSITLPFRVSTDNLNKKITIKETTLKHNGCQIPEIIR